ncbi:MAG: YggS family pyridoxal phosphate-dependent enzyme [Gammaproteobacteria bacterium]|nr:YggS family pyridoxal phosphate-dependent enzyme [Gammaproteobacteria bacterium]
MSELEDRYRIVRERIVAAAQKYERDLSTITLLAVSKTWPTKPINEFVRMGQQHFAENYLQEAMQKIYKLKSSNLIWHFIGALQSNKTNIIAKHFDWVQTLASFKHAQRLNDQRPEHLPPLKVCIQINVANETRKAGVTFAQLNELAFQIAELPRLQLRGLMAIPQKMDTFKQQRKQFASVRHAADSLNQSKLNIDTLSMGMSHDLEAAIAEGATLVRVGTALFGTRAK